MKTKICVYKGDITKIKVDAIVNTANKTLLGGWGVDGAIHRASGPKLLKECKKLGGCKKGEAKLTGGYNLPAKCIIHTVGPIYGAEKKQEKKILMSCYLNSLKLAQEHNLKTIAFSSISTGAYCYPKKEAAKIAIKTIKDFIASDSDYFKKIIFVLFSDQDLEIYKKVLCDFRLNFTNF